MNDSGPLTPEHIDLLLSADLDGEFDAAASDLGLDATTARAQLDADPTIAARRAHIEAARDLLAEPIEIDELLATRLRAKAVKAGAEAADQQRHARSSNRTRAFGIVSGIAAALLVVVGLGAMLRTSESSKSSSDSASGAPVVESAPTSWSLSETTGKSAPAAAVNGDIARQQLSLRATYADIDALVDDVREKGLAFAPQANTASGTDHFKSADSASSAYKCVPTAQKLESLSDQPLANGTTQVAGQSYSVLLYGGSNGRTAFVFDRECKLVNQQRIH